MPAILQVPGTARLTEPFDSYSTQRFPLGTRLITFDGREFAFGENDATLEVAGTVYQSEVPNAADDDIAVAAAAIGARSVTITSNAEAVVANEFNGGYMVVQDDAGEGRVYLIDDTPAISASTAGVIALAHGVEVAFTAATTVLLMKHPMKDVIIHDSPPTAPVIGVAVSAIAANEFGWYQKRGIASVLTEGTVVIGQQVRAGETTDGTIAALDYDEAGRDEAILGVVHEVGATGEHSPINLMIP